MRGCIKGWCYTSMTYLLANECLWVCSWELVCYNGTIDGDFRVIKWWGFFCSFVNRCWVLLLIIISFVKVCNQVVVDNVDVGSVIFKNTLLGLAKKWTCVCWVACLICWVHLFFFLLPQPAAHTKYWKIGIFMYLFSKQMQVQHQTVNHSKNYG